MSGLIISGLIVLCASSYHYPGIKHLFTNNWKTYNIVTGIRSI